MSAAISTRGLILAILLAILTNAISANAGDEILAKFV